MKVKGEKHSKFQVYMGGEYKENGGRAQAWEALYEVQGGRDKAKFPGLKVEKTWEGLQKIA